jgi:signal peptidase II
MEFKKRIPIVFLILLGCIICDQATKSIAKRIIPQYEIIHLMNDTLRFQHAENPGAFLSFGAGISEPVRYVVFTLLVGIFLAGLLIFLLTSRQLTRNQVIALSVILGGGFGNLIDRIFNHGHVFDFVNLGIGWLRTGVFNVADMAITFGVLWFLFLSIRNRERTPQ